MASNTPYLLLVEGPDDYHIIRNLWRKQHTTEPPFAIRSTGGKAQLKADLPRLIELLLADDQSLQRLGVVVDVDTTLASEWESLSQLAQQAGYQHMPSAPATEGTIITETGQAPLGIWLMPDNQNPGIVETFMRSLIPTDDPLFARAESCVQTVGADLRCDPRKAVVRTWLAWQAEPGRQMGEGITFNYFDTTLPPASLLLGWLHRLFP